jgi:hypothetical protein
MKRIARWWKGLNEPVRFAIGICLIPLSPFLAAIFIVVFFAVMLGAGIASTFDDIAEWLDR